MCIVILSEDEILEYSENEEETLDILPDNLDVKDEAQLSRLSGELYGNYNISCFNVTFE